MTVVVRLFARARDLAGRDAIILQLPTGADVGDVRKAIAAVHAPLAELLPRCAIAVNEEFAADDHLLPEDATVAVIPPVSGG